MSALALAFAVVFVAEFGDKTQLLTLVLAARLGVRPVLAGVAIATAALSALSVVAGASLRHALPAGAMTIAAGVTFCAVAVWVWRAPGPADNDQTPPRHHGAGAVATAALTFLVSEIGDKTMIATIALAAGHPALAVWAGATLAVVAAEAVAVLVGKKMADHVASPLLRGATSGVFAATGIALLASRLLVA